jgi:hypothetical protein
MDCGFAAISVSLLNMTEHELGRASAHLFHDFPTRLGGDS